MLEERGYERLQVLGEGSFGTALLVRGRRGAAKMELPITPAPTDQSAIRETPTGATVGDGCRHERLRQFLSTVEEQRQVFLGACPSACPEPEPVEQPRPTRPVRSMMGDFGKQPQRVSL
ncbi:unnamed protein product [Effrenium voratum]|nr:unnamed protein product [Effrenium voratum]